MKYCFILLLTLSVLSLKSQVKYSKGFLYKNSDTVYVKIKTFDEKDLYQITIKDSLNNIRSYNANELIGFGLVEESTEYFSFKLPFNKKYDISQAMIDSRSEHRNPDQMYFCKRIASGRIELFELQVKGLSPRYFARKDNERFVELKQVIEVKNGIKYTNNDFRQKLAVLFFENEKLKKKSQKIAYRKSAFVKLIKEYNLINNQ